MDELTYILLWLNLVAVAGATVVAFFAAITERKKSKKLGWCFLGILFALATVGSGILLDDASHQRFCEATNGVKVEEQSRKTVITVCTDDWWRE